MLDRFVRSQHSSRSRGHQISGVPLFLAVFSLTFISMSMGVMTDNKLLGFVYASQFVDYQLGLRNNGNLIEPPHSDPSLALGEPERENGNNFVSLGFGGYIILDFGELPSQTDLIQLEVFEASPGKTDCEKNPEKAEIYLGNDLVNWEEIGIACQGKKFDISSYAPFRYIYIQDVSDPVAFPQGEDGYDLDGVILAHCQYCSEPTITISPPVDIPTPDNIFSPTVSFTDAVPTVTNTPESGTSPSDTAPSSLTPLSTPEQSGTMTPTTIPTLEPSSSPTNTEPSSPTPSLIPQQSGTVTPTYTPTYTSTMTATELPTFSNTLVPLLCSPVPADVVLVIDRSGSMQGGPLESAKFAAKSFVDLMSLENDQIGVVSFSTSANLDQTLTHNRIDIIQAIDSLWASGQTNIARGISTAHTELISDRHNVDATQVTILLSDGNPTAGDAMRASQLAKEVGIRIITIGLGGNINENLMRSIASSESDYFYAPVPSDLLAIYQDIAQIVHCLTPTRTPSATFTPSLTSTITLTPSPSRTATTTFTPSLTPTITLTPSYTPSHTPTTTFTPSSTPTIDLTPSRTPTRVLTATPTLTPLSTPTSTPTALSLEKPELIEPANGTTVPQPVLPNQWIFVWQAVPDPCHSIIAVNGPDGQFFSDSVYNSFGQPYEYVYSQANSIPNGKLQSWSWQVTIVCPFGRNTSEKSSFSVARAPFDWERFGQNIGNILALLGVLFTVLYVLGLIPFVLYFEKIAQVLNKNPGIKKALVIIEYFSWLEVIFKLIDTYQSTKIKKNAETTRLEILNHLDESSQIMEQMISNGRSEDINRMSKQLDGLIKQFKDNNLRFNELSISHRFKYDTIYDWLKLEE